MSVADNTDTGQSESDGKSDVLQFSAENDTIVRLNVGLIVGALVLLAAAAAGYVYWRRTQGRRTQ